MIMPTDHTLLFRAEPETHIYVILWMCGACLVDDRDVWWMCGGRFADDGDVLLTFCG